MESFTSVPFNFYADKWATPVKKTKLNLIRIKPVRGCIIK